MENPSLARLGLKQQNLLPVCWSCAQDRSWRCLFLRQGQHEVGGWRSCPLPAGLPKIRRGSIVRAPQRLSGFPESLWGWTGSVWSWREDKGIFRREKSSSPPSPWGSKKCRARDSLETPEYCVILGICKCRFRYYLGKKCSL